MKTSIIYNSHSGTTEAYAGEIGKFLTEKGIENKVESIQSYDKEFFKSADIVLLGCWTGGLFLFAQHPDKAWKAFAQEMPEIKNKKVALFTTYKLATGSMFKKMEARLTEKIDVNKASIKSKTSKLSDANKVQLEQLIGDN